METELLVPLTDAKIGDPAPARRRAAGISEARILGAFMNRAVQPMSLKKSASIFFPGISFRPVRTVRELVSAGRVLYGEYLRQRYIPPNARQMRLTVHQALPSSVVLVAIHDSGEVLATVSVVLDSPLGLPMDAVFGDELDRRRSLGERLAECGSLASNDALLRRGPFSLSPHGRRLLVYHLVWAVFDIARSTERFDALLACYHPKHASFYDHLGFVRAGDERAHPSVQGSPAVAGIMDVKNMETASAFDAIRKILYGPIPADPIGRRLLLKPADVEDLFVDADGALSHLTDAQAAYLESCFPGATLDQLLGRKQALVRWLGRMARRYWERRGRPRAAEA